jgi:predicted esterase
MLKIKVSREYLQVGSMKTVGLSFVPNLKMRPYQAIFTHGYTAHKDTLLTWGQRLASEGIPTLIFDLPGHYLGHFHEVEDFSEFKNHAHELFFQAQNILAGYGQNQESVILGGHSLGALLAMKAAPLFNHVQSIISVGYGLAPEDVEHVFATSLFQQMMEIRSQLVSPALDPKNIFPWIKAEKEQLNLTGQQIYLLNGSDDVVVNHQGSLKMQEKLESLGNQVVFENPKSLPHHLPDRAAPHIISYLKKFHFR